MSKINHVDKVISTYLSVRKKLTENDIKSDLSKKDFEELATQLTQISMTDENFEMLTIQLQKIVMISKNLEKSKRSKGEDSLELIESTFESPSNGENKIKSVLKSPNESAFNYEYIAESTRKSFDNINNQSKIIRIVFTTLPLLGVLIYLLFSYIPNRLHESNSPKQEQNRLFE